MHPFVRGHHAPHSSDPLLKKRLKRRDAPAPCVPAALDCASDLAFRLRSDPVSGPCVPALCLDPALGCLRSGCVPALRPGACVPTALPDLRPGLRSDCIPAPRLASLASRPRFQRSPRRGAKKGLASGARLRYYVFRFRRCRGHEVRAWRNWQTRTVQVRMGATPYTRSRVPQSSFLEFINPGQMEISSSYRTPSAPFREAVGVWLGCHGAIPMHIQ